jgi:hypothetical protein
MASLALVLCPILAVVVMGWPVGMAVATGWVLSLVWSSAVGFLSGWHWRRELYRLRLDSIQRDFNARLGLDRIEVWLHTDDGLSVRDLTPVDPQGLPLLDANAVRAELARAGQLMERGDSWGHNSHRVHNAQGQRSRVTFEALRDRWVAAGLLHPPRQGAPLEFTPAGMATINQAMEDELCLALFDGGQTQSGSKAPRGAGR